MKVTIVTFEPEIKHLPIAVKGGHGEAVDYLNSKYDFSYLLPVGAWPYLELQEHPSLSYLASVQIIGGGKFVPVAKLNTVTLIEPNNQSEEEFLLEQWEEDYPEIQEGAHVRATQRIAIFDDMGGGVSIEPGQVGVVEYYYSDEEIRVRWDEITVNDCSIDEIEVL